MLELAFKFKTELENKMLETMFDEKYKYYHDSNYCEYEMTISNSSWDRLELVSVDKNGHVQGYFKADIHRGDDMINGIRAINFNNMNYAFSKDFHQFITDLLLKYNYRKITFGVVVGNPAEHMYDKYIDRYSGRIVGTKLKDVKLYDGSYYDIKTYEIFREDFLKVYNNKKLHN